MTAADPRVWSPAVRLLHAALIASVGLSALATVAVFDLHQPAGYVALGIVGVRTLIGLTGHGPAAFASFIRGPRATCRYALAVLRGCAPRHVGHNPLGGWMALALMICIALLALTGWLYTTDRFFGDETVETLHRALAWALLGLVVAHLGGAVAMSWRHRENLFGAMLHGRKRAAGPDDVG